MDERRKLPRWKIQKQVKVWLPHMQNFQFATIEDLHLKGMCMSFNRPIPSADTLKMSLAMGEDFDFIKIEAQVPWKRQTEDRFVYGLSFTHVAEQDKERMYAYINDNCYDQFKNKWWA